MQCSACCDPCWAVAASFCKQVASAQQQILKLIYNTRTLAHFCYRVSQKEVSLVKISCGKYKAGRWEIFKISSNFSLWLGKYTNSHCSFSQNVCPLHQVHGRALHIHGRSFQSNQTIWKSPKGWQQSVSIHYQDCVLHLDSLLHKDLSIIPYVFLTNHNYICHSWFRLNSLF